MFESGQPDSQLGEVADLHRRIATLEADLAEAQKETDRCIGLLMIARRKLEQISHAARLIIDINEAIEAIDSRRTTETEG